MKSLMILLNIIWLASASVVLDPLCPPSSPSCNHTASEDGVGQLARVQVRKQRRLRSLLSADSESEAVMLKMGVYTLEKGENNLQVSEIDDHYIYVVTNDSPGTVVKIRKVDLARIKSLTLHHGENFVETSISDQQFLYLGTHTSPGDIIKVRKSDLAHDGKMTLQAGMTSLTLQADQNFLYICTFTAPGKILKVNKADMQVKDVTQTELSLRTGESWLLTSQSDRQYLYVCTSETPGVVVKVRKADMSIVDQSTLQSGESLIQTSQIDDKFIYVATNDSPGKVVQIRKSDMSRVASLTLNAGENLVQTSDIDVTPDVDGNRFLFVATNPYGMPAIIVKILIEKTEGGNQVPDLTRIGSITMAADEFKPFTSTSDTKYLYIGLRTQPGKVIKISKSQVINCEVSPWTAWDECTETCAGGIQGRTRTIVTQPSDTGRACPELNQTQACNTQACPINCQVGDWTPWSECEQATGNIVRTRVITVEANVNGAACPTLEATRHCIVDCVLSDWSSWSSCDRMRGKRIRTRSAVYEPRNGGASCDKLADEVNCNVDCAVSGWSGWSVCDKLRGVQQRHRRVITMNKNDGIKCPVLTDYQDCIVHCEVGPWTSYNDCKNEGVGLGSATRTRPLVVTEKNGGLACTLTEVADCAASCEVSDWSSWSECDIEEGTRFKTRTIRSPAVNGGSACPILRTTENCAVDCEVSEWSSWLACNPETSLQFKTRLKIHDPKNGGTPCPELIQSRNCTLDCTVSHWSEWDSCSQVCGGGTQQRFRVVEVDASAGGKECPALSDSRPCNTAACGENDCVVSEWSDWTACTVECGGGTKERTRVVTRPQGDGGRACPNLKDELECNTELCVVDCQVSGWSDWADCNSEHGKKSRTREILKQPMNGGAKCPPINEEVDCPVDCEVSDFSDWEACNEALGMQQRSRAVLVAARNGGTGCPALNEFKDCGNTDCSIYVTQWTEFSACVETGDNAGTQSRTRAHLTENPPAEAEKCVLSQSMDCTLNCKVSDWAEWSDCTKEHGKREKQRTIQVWPMNGGSDCPPLTEEEPCTVDCEVSSFSDWGACDKTTGTKMRSRSITIHPKNGGAACPIMSQDNTCPVDCELSAWSDWSACNMDTGVKERSRDVLVSSQNGGAACGTLQEFDDCNTDMQCKSDAWSNWSECNKEGEAAGFQVRTRNKIPDIDSVTGADLNEGKPCRLEERVKCAVSCEVSDWSTWGDCDTEADKKTRSREVMIPAMNGGVGCPELEEHTTCVIDCKVDQWGPWSDCAKDVGRRVRSRAILIVPENNGKECPSTKEQEVCQVDCEMSDWAAWGACDPNSGMKMRERTVIYHVRNGGIPCGILTEYDDCMVHCEATEWSAWSECAQVGANAGEQSRTRAVLINEKNDGTPCTLEETVKCPVDCKVSDWSDWRACNHLNNKQKRSRTVIYRNVNEGTECPNLQEYRSCGLQKEEENVIEEDTKVIDANIPEATYNTAVYSEMYFGGITPERAQSEGIAEALKTAFVQTFGWTPGSLVVTVRQTSEQDADRRRLSEVGATLDIEVKAGTPEDGVQIWTRLMETKESIKGLEKKITKNLRDEGKSDLADLFAAKILIPTTPTIVAKRQETAATQAIKDTDASGEKYSRVLTASFDITGYSLVDFLATMQYIFLVNLAEELNTDPKSVVITSFTQVDEKKLDFECVVRATDQKAADIAFRLQVVASEPQEFQKKFVDYLTKTGRSKDGVAITTDGSVHTETIQTEEDMIAQQEEEESTTGEGTGEEAGTEEGGGGGMANVGGAVLGAFIAVLLVLVIIRYRKQKKAKEAFFRRMEGEDNDNLLGDDDDGDWE